MRDWIGLSKVQSPTWHILCHFGDDGVTAVSARIVATVRAHSVWCWVVCARPLLITVVCMCIIWKALCPYVLDARLGLWVSLEHAFTCVACRCIHSPRWSESWQPLAAGFHWYCDLSHVLQSLLGVLYCINYICILYAGLFMCDVISVTKCTTVAWSLDHSLGGYISYIRLWNWV